MPLRQKELAARSGARRERRYRFDGESGARCCCAHGTRSNVLVAGVAGLVAGAMAMAAERAELKADDKGEHEELTAIYVALGLDPSLAEQVAHQLMALMQ